MTKKLDKPIEKSEPLFIVGLDDKAKARGGRFTEVDDRVVNTALDMKLVAVIRASSAFAAAAQKLPAGRLYASGKWFIPNIKEALHDELFAILRTPGDSSEALQVRRTETSDAIKCVSPITAGLPRDWEEIEVGHLVLAHAGYEDGWWESIVVSRVDSILTLRYRDAPKVPAFQRHLSTVALINPGTLPDKS